MNRLRLIAALAPAVFPAMTSVTAFNDALVIGYALLLMRRPLLDRSFRISSERLKHWHLLNVLANVIADAEIPEPWVKLRLFVQAAQNSL